MGTVRGSTTRTTQPAKLLLEPSRHPSCLFMNFSSPILLDGDGWVETFSAIIRRAPVQLRSMLDQVRARLPFRGTLLSRLHASQTTQSSTPRLQPPHERSSRLKCKFAIVCTSTTNHLGSTPAIVECSETRTKLRNVLKQCLCALGV